MNFETLTKQEWLDLHHSPETVSASQAYYLTGDSEWMSPYSLWAVKTGRCDPPEETEAMRMGHYMEPYIANKFTEETGISLEDPGDYTIIRHPDYPWLFSTLDRYYKKGDLISPVELKWTQFFINEWVDDAPLPAQAQLQIQMACTGAKEGHLAGYGMGQFYTHTFQRHDKLIEGLIKTAKQFREMCMTDTPPPIDGDISTTKTLNKLYPEHDPDKCVTLDSSFDEIAIKLKETKSDIKTLKSVQTYYENLIKDRLGDAEFGKTESGIGWSYKTINRKGYTTQDTSFRQLRQIG